MKKSNVIPVGIGVIILVLFLALKAPVKETNNYEYKQVTTLESVVGAGFGRSSVMETTCDTVKVLSDYELKNFFSAAGINMGNVQVNEQSIVKIICDMQNEGWELFLYHFNSLEYRNKKTRDFFNPAFIPTTNKPLKLNNH